MSATFDASKAWVLADQVALRPEPFGALAYHFGTRRLSFLKSPVLVQLVQALGAHPNALQACTAVATDASRPAMLGALEALARTGMIVPQERR
jgi:mycofactocin biosynthesis protein MftB